MFDEGPLESALRDGLRALPTPELSPDFDARILAALSAPRPWWQRLWEPARPLLLGASCSLVVTLIALHWTLTAPLSAPMSRAALPGLAAAPRPLPSLDALLDQPYLSAGSLAAVWAAPPVPSPGRRPEPPRHAQAGCRAFLVV